MNSALVVFNNATTPTKYKEDVKHILWHFFLKHFDIWHHHLHKLYVLDYDCDLTIPDWANHLGGKIRIIENPFINHYDSLNKFIPSIPEDDLVFILDSDMVIWDAKCVSEGYNHLLTYDAAGILSTDGCRMRIKNTVFDKNKVRGRRGKLANWYTFVRGKWLKNADFNYLPWGTYYIEPFTERIVMEGGNIKELPEDYWQIVCNVEGKIYEQYYESEDGHFIETNKDVKDLGYYHIWHASHMWKFLDDTFESVSFSHQEQLRLGVWAYVMTEMVDPDKLPLFDDAIKRIGHFPKYVTEFKKYHSSMLKAMTPKTKS